MVLVGLEGRFKIGQFVANKGKEAIHVCFAVKGVLALELGVFDFR